MKTTLQMPYGSAAARLRTVTCTQQPGVDAWAHGTGLPITPPLALPVAAVPAAAAVAAPPPRGAPPV